MFNIIRTGCFSALFFCIGFAAWGDDLDIYLGTSSSAVTYNPNVLFIMDTSGSMTNTDGTGESRMLRVQNALKTALGSSTNINAGLMRFSDYGGPILFPIRGVDDVLSAELVNSTDQSTHDAYEINGSVNLGSSSLVLSLGTSTVTTGLRFEDVNVPQGATITSAYLRFTSAQFSVSPAELTIRAEANADSAEFSSNNGDLSNRVTTAAYLEWNSDNEFPVSNDIATTPDFSDVVQEVVDLSGWCGGDALTLLIEGEGLDPSSSRLARSYDQGQGSSPQLVLTYDDSTATGCVAGEGIYQISSNDDNLEETTRGYDSTGAELTFYSYYNSYIGIRFENVNIPQGATITEAYLEFTAYDSYSNSNASMLIRGIDEDDVDDFSSSRRYRLRDTPKTSGVTWTMPNFRRRNDIQSPDVSSIVSHITSRGSWQPGNALGFVLSDFTSYRGAYSARDRPSYAPRLVVKYRGNATPGASSTVRDHLISKVDELSASGYTPIVDTLYEAVSYYGGLDVDYGLTRGNSYVSSSVRRNTRVSHRNSYIGADAVRPSGCSESDLSDSDCMGEYIPSGATYISPVTDLQCQTNNHIVLLSDGEANNNHSVGEIQTLLGTSCTGSGGEKCGLDLVRNVSDRDTSVIDRRIITHTIGFAANNTANNFLNQLAIQSGGGFYRAENSTELLDAFNTILRSVKDINATFVSPGVAVNQLNRLTHRDELYFALFKPAEGAIWPGNLKRYQLRADTVLDKNGLDAVDSVTGFFSENSHSFWSVLADGNDVREGGAASLLNSSRNLYVFDGEGNIAQSSNALHESNNSITSGDLGIEEEYDPESLRTTLLKWARGVDVRDSDGDGDTSDVRLQMGDPIHSQPVIVNYSNTDSAIFVATNHGMLHSIDASSGEENFAIMPKSLLPNLQHFYENVSTFDHIYGLDGDMVLRTIGSDTYLYLGMRRGGRDYFVFDVSNKTSPRLVFQIQGGSEGLEKLGQSWSRPTITKVRYGNQDKNVMIIGGGYDESQDDKAIRSPDSVGNAVFMFDADTGDLIWQASNANADLTISEMNYSIPGRISVIDRDNDGYADHMYAADMGGQVFRMDIYNGQSGTNFVKGERLADFGGETAVENRRFFYGPDVTEVALGEELYYGVAIGSGWRASPLDITVEDAFYFIKDDGVFRRDNDGYYTYPTSITPTSLYDATNHALTSTDSTAQGLASSEFANKQGWFIRLTTGGEKVLASPLILDYKVFFTTYVPAVSSTSACAPPTGSSRAYLVNMFNGNAVDDLNNDGVLDEQDRAADLKQTGIAPETKILIEEMINPVVCLGTECASAVAKFDQDGNALACTSSFACLVENIYGKFERVQRGSWTSETERATSQ